MITLTQDGVKYTVKGYQYVGKGEYFINLYGDIQQHIWGGGPRPWHLVVVPAPVEYMFSGVVFVETGECRPVQSGEWYLAAIGPLGTYPVYRKRQTPSEMPYKILRPVRLDMPDQGDTLGVY